MAVSVRRAVARDHLGVMRVLDGAMLDVDSDTVERRIAAGGVFVADDDHRVVGALLTLPRETGAHVEAIAVRRARRDAGIGSRLVQSAAERWRPLTADFRREVRPFYASLGFDIEERGDRYRGTLR
ncbi:GNAT family N-acetyltransferase [Salarchaeum japonicum]|uniref:GNAT family N-acetyltransferase n=1 Tax=Salarchaeum japonicum TaxID=555573 RepID=A0AAV3SZX2_9EURY|nr:GNAT family N-acetyltransferase [Salarchaeum japonicum]